MIGEANRRILTARPSVLAFLISAFVILTRPAMVADWVNTVFDLF
ncbi:hypothetical protein ACIBG4_26745 [Nonomuraea sp. NPDC050383]